MGTLSLALLAAAAGPTWAQLGVELTGIDVSSIAAQQPHQIETALGAQCPSGTKRQQPSLDLFEGTCSGKMPEHLVQAFLAIPSPLIHLSGRRKKEFLAKPSMFKAIPGKGQRADFMASIEQVGWIRSLEGPDPNSTAYLVNGPFDCPKEPEGTDAIGDVGCVNVGNELRVFVRKNGGPLVDVTEKQLSVKQRLSDAEMKRLLSYRYNHPDDVPDLSWVVLDVSRLGVMPVLRRLIPVASDDPVMRLEPRLFGHGDLHFGFEEWNGVRFVWKARVTSALWPCLKGVGGRPCDDRETDPREPFVTPLP